MKLTKDNVVNQEVNPEKIWNMIESFASYAFNKSHAVAYSLISYQTARVWYENKDKFLEYVMNNSKSEKVKKALEKTAELGYTLNFPDFHDIKQSEHWIVENKTVTPPIDVSLSYDYLSDFLFSNETKTVKANMIVRGVLDKSVPDRFGLRELNKNIQSKFNSIPHFPQCNTLRDVIHNGELMGVWNVKKDDENKYVLDVIKARSTTEVTIYKSLNSMPLERVEFSMKQDIKYFGIVRPGILDKKPNLNIEQMLKMPMKAREKLLSGRKPEDIPYKTQERYKISDGIKRAVSKAFYDEKYRKSFDDINDTEYKVLVREIVYNKSYNTVKVTLGFDNGDMDFWLRPNVAGDVIKQVNTYKKGEMHKVKLKIDSYLNKNLEPVVQYKIRTFTV